MAAVTVSAEKIRPFPREVTNPQDGKRSLFEFAPRPLAGAAPGTWRAGLAYAARYLGDTAVAAETVEGVVHSAAKAHRHKPIKNPDSYLLAGIVRRVKKLLARERRVEYRGSLEELEAG